MANIEKLVGDESRLELGQKINEIIDTKVSKSGDTMTGALSFQESDTFDYTDTNHTTISETSGYICFKDKNNKTCGAVSNYFNQYNNLVTRLTASREIGGVVKNADLSVYVDKDGNPTTQAPTPASTDNSTKIATTAFVKSVLSSSGNGLATFKKAANGYIKFSNGIIIQWGRTGSFSGKTTVTLPIAFSSTNYSVVTGLFLETDYTANWGAFSYTTTSFVLHNQSSGGKTYTWLAIGY